MQARATSTLTQLQRLSLSLRDLPSETLDGIFREFRALSRLSYLSVTHAALFGPCMNSFAAHLASFPALQTLDLSSNGIDEDGARSLAPFVAQLHSLHTLDLNYNRICGEGMLPARFYRSALILDTGAVVSLRDLFTGFELVLL